jgi:hypothetical protein
MRGSFFVSSFRSISSTSAKTKSGKGAQTNKLMAAVSLG